VQSSNKRLLIYGWVLLTLFYLFLRYQNIPGVFSSTGLIVPDTDPYYRMHRIESIVQNSWTYPLHDKMVNYPAGINVAWPLGLDYILAAPLKLLGFTDTITIMTFCFMMIPLLTLPILFLTGGVASLLSVPALGLAAAAFVTLMKTLLYQTGVGRVDHHALECLFIMLNLWFFFKVQSGSNSKLRYWMMASLGLASAIYPHGWLSIFCLCLALLPEKQIKVQREFSRIFFYAFLLSLIPLSFSDRFWNGYVSISGFSWWSSICLLWASSFTLILSFIWEKKNSDRKYSITVLFFFLLVHFFLLVKNQNLFFIQQIQHGANWLAGQGSTLETTRESWSPFHYEPKKLHDILLIFLMPVVYLWFLFRKKYTAILLYAVIPITFVFLQIRFMASASSLIAILVVLWLWDVLEFVSLGKMAKKTVFVLLLLSISLLYFPKMGLTENKTHDYFFYPVRHASQFIREQIKEKSQDPKNTSVLAPWYFGHWIVFYANAPVIADPFQFNQSSQVMRLMASEDDQAFEQIQRDIPFDYMMVAQDNARLAESVYTMGKPVEEYFTIQPSAEGNDVFLPTEMAKKTFAYRWMAESGIPKNWKLVYTSPYPSLDDKNTPALKVFEKLR
jgi:asparagine N-glycosylation enzyme membrane subunit Stt3